MQCSECGRELDPQARFCDACRAPVAYTGVTQRLVPPAEEYEWREYTFDGGDVLKYRVKVGGS